MRVALFVALLSVAHGWVTTSQSVYGAQISEIQQQMHGQTTGRYMTAELGFLWYMPESTDNTRGLGGGITWALNSQLCDRLMPNFREDVIGASWITSCESIHAAIARAFDKWAANSRFLKFVDMTEECNMAGLNHGPPTSAHQNGTACDPTNLQPGCIYPHGGCPLAEIWVTSLVNPNSDDVSSTEYTSGGTAVATAQPHVQAVSDFRYTNGATPYYNNSNVITSRPVVETFAGTLSFNTHDVCWYLDSMFCAPFHGLKRTLGSPENARLFIWCLTFGLTAVAILFYIALICTAVMRALHCGICEEEGERNDQGIHKDDEDGDGKLSCGERFNAILRVLSGFNPFVLTIFIMLLVLPGLLTTRIFAPCFDCFDFEAATLHEIGHFLGLGHPDNIPDNWMPITNPSYVWALPSPGNNSYHSTIAHSLQNQIRPDAAAFCHDPWAQVMAGVPEGAEIDEMKLDMRYPTRDAQMEARTQHNPSSCLYEDDLEALAVLYPDCHADTAMFEAVCHTVDLNIGIVRCSAYILFPSIIALMFIIACSSIVHRFEKREQERLHNKYAQEKREMSVAHAEEIKRTRIQSLVAAGMKPKAGSGRSFGFGRWRSTKKNLVQVPAESVEVTSTSSGV